ncbi:MAG: acyloxyacyl hydrolase [Bacteroidales bacterium]|nr:acyloxyacyl hydrolase [Bacteroidales bacterium]
MIKSIRSLTALFLLFFVALPNFAQRHRNSGLFLEMHGMQGLVLQSNDFVRGENRKEIPIKSFSATDLRLGWQSRGDKAWHHTHNLPYYGIGIHNIVFSKVEELGYPAALYFFFGAPFSRNTKSSFDYEFSFGLSHNWEPYDDVNNPFNLAIGSYRNAYIDAKVKYVRYLGKRMSLDAGFRFTHFSNGAMRFPNAGINLFAPFVGLRYNLIVRDPIPLENLKQQEVENKEELNIIVASGKRAVRNTDTPNHKMVSLVNISLEYLKPAGNIFKYGVGLDLGIDQNRNLTVDGDNVELASKHNQIFSSVAALGQFRANRLAVQAGIGYEFLNDGKIQFNSETYQRIGLRFYIHKHFFAGIAIKAKKFSRADYIEWSVGYSI